jgi:hypothetical protein
MEKIMKNSFFWLAFIVGIIAVIGACSKSEDDSSSSSTTTYASSASGATASGTITLGNYSISGTYASACFSASDSSAPTDATHIGFVAVVTGNDNYTLETNYYTDSTCTADTLSFGSYMNIDNVTDQGPTASDSTANQKVTYVLENLSFMVKTTAADTFATALWSAFSIDFEVDVLKVLSSGLSYYNIIKVTGTGGDVYFGDPDRSAYPSTVGSNKYVKQ